MNKLFKMLQESFGSAPQRNGFDLSRREIFSTKVGIKVPCFVLETVPNDYHEIRPVNLIRTLPFNEANFVRMKQYLDFYFVPFTALMSNFHEYAQQTTDPVNSLLVGQNVEKTFPVFPLDALLLAVFMAHEVEYYARKDIFGSFDLETFLNNVDGSVEGSAHDVYAEYSELCEIFIRKIVTTNPSSVRYDCVRDMFNNPIYRDVVRLLDMLGYGNYLNVISYEAVDDDGFFYLYAGRLITLVRGKLINLFRLCAYQCVYQNFGINTVYDKLNVYSFNLDDVVRKSAESGITLGWLSRKDTFNSYDVWWKVNSIFSIHYSQWKKDIFTSAYPDSQFGGVSVVSVNHTLGDSISSLSANAAKLLGVTTNSFDGGSGQTVALNRTAPVGGNYAFSSFNILDLRRAEALQGWKEDMMRSGFRAKQRQKSQFGVAPSFDPHCMPYVLGSVSSDITKDTVTGTSGDQFAELAATGMSTLGKDVIKFDGTGRNDFGIIIGLLSVVPEADYDAVGIDSHNIKVEPFDFYTPAFQNIGLQPLPIQVLNNSRLIYPLNSSSILGYVPRYYDYKQAVDKVHGEFCTFTKRPLDTEANPSDYVGQFRSYVSTRYDMENLGLSRLNSLYVNPAIVDDIFKVIVDGDNRQSTDQFMVNAYFDVKSVRPMSVLGLPRW